MVTFESYTEECSYIVNNFLAADINTISVEPSLKGSEQVEMGVQVIEIGSDFSINRKQAVIGVCP